MRNSLVICFFLYRCTRCILAIDFGNLFLVSLL